MDVEGRKCRICGNNVAILNRRVCNQCKHAKDKHKWQNSYEAYIGSRVRIAKARAKKYGLAFDIDSPFIFDLLEKQNYRCAMTGFPLTRTGEQGDHDLSIDRVDSDRGYEKDNVVLVCNRVNMMKNTKSLDMFVWWCKAVANYDQDRRSRQET